MKQVNITKQGFDFCLYPAIANLAVDNVAEIRTAGKVLEKLIIVGKEVPAPKVQQGLCEQCNTQFTRTQTRKIPSSYELEGPGTTLEFEDSEAEFVIQQITAILPGLAAVIAVSVVPMIDQLEKKDPPLEVVE